MVYMRSFCLLCRLADEKSSSVMIYRALQCLVDYGYDLFNLDPDKPMENCLKELKGVIDSDGMPAPSTAQLEEREIREPRSAR